MSGNTFGSIFKVTTFGESHGSALGAVIDGCPANIPLNSADIQKALDKRKPHASGNYDEEISFSTQRKEADSCEILSGIFNGVTLGTPISIVIHNQDACGKDYENLKTVYRPGHADFSYDKKYGIRDFRGGGRASGRETAARVAAGAVAKQVLDFFSAKYNTAQIEIETWAEEIAGIKTGVPVFFESALPEPVLKKLTEIKKAGDSAGAIIACEISCVPAGLGSPVFSKLEAELAKAMLSIGGIKGIEFGVGFSSAAMTGFEHNSITGNCNGGIIGGISTGGKIFFRLAVKPVPSIKKQQKAFDNTGSIINLTISGRHDVCLFPRILPVIEAMAFLTLADSFLMQRAIKHH